MILGVNGISKSFGDEGLFENVTFNIEQGDKIGFIGSNGAGKSTLFKLLIGELDRDSGEVYLGKDLSIGYLDQYSCKDSTKSIFDETVSVFDDLLNAEGELEDINLQLELGDASESLLKRQHYLNEYLSDNEGYVFRAKVKSTLIGLGFSEEDLSTSVSTLSGGQKTRVELAKIILSRSNLLLLDEPTNHLDIESCEWLENFLLSYKGAYIIISHDRYFLDKTTNRIFELDNGKFTTYPGNYSAYKKQKDVIKTTLEREYAATSAEIKRLEGVIEQQRRWNREKNIKTAESKQKVVDRLKAEIIEPLKPHELMSYSLRSCGECGNDVLICTGIKKTFDGVNYLLDSSDLFIKKHNRVFLLGPNGCGKTTLLKIIQSFEPASGEIKIGSNVKIGYYDQLQEGLDEKKTIFDEVHDAFPTLTNTEVRNALASFFFYGEDVFKTISSLSGGERSRVALCKLLLQDVNFLILDEPTNHLDIEAKESLENALQAYDGTMLVVSHDRYFINKLASEIIYMQDGKLTRYDGDYDYFVEKTARNPLPTTGGPLHFDKGRSDSHSHQVGENLYAPVNKANSYNERKAYESAKRKARSALERKEAEIAVIEQKIEDLNNELMLPDVATDYVKSGEISMKLTEVNNDLDKAYSEWEELNKNLERYE